MTRPKVSFRTYGRHLWTWMALILVISVLIFTPLAIMETRKARLLASEGVDTTGTVIDRGTTTSRNSSGSIRRNYYLLVEFTTQTGSNVRYRRSVSHSLYDATAQGASVPVRYAASNPSVAESVPGQTARSARWLVILASVLGAGTLASLWALQRGVAAQKRAARDGERRTARVLAHHKVGKARSKSYAIEWDDGVKVQRTTAFNESQLPPVGSDIVVYLDPRSGKGWWEREF